MKSLRCYPLRDTELWSPHTISQEVTRLSEGGCSGVKTGISPSGGGVPNPPIGGGRGVNTGVNFAQYSKSQKLHEIERIWMQRGGVRDALACNSLEGLSGEFGHKLTV